MRASNDAFLLACAWNLMRVAHHTFASVGRWAVECCGSSAANSRKWILGQPARLFLLFEPLGRRSNCYSYRRAMDRAALLMACAVGECNPARAHNNLRARRSTGPVF